ncbi:MAG: glycosyltransferase family 4 protein [Minisyncoccia bacterium]|jgi:glycosyltransferase involved in cell wall biosynthesis
MRILIASGIYPPDIGGSAQYAYNLYETWKRQGHQVKVAAYRWERAVPSPLSNLLYLTKVLRKAWRADLVLVLDTWSAAVPAMMACAILRKRYILRTGGDRLWEAYAERTGEPVLFKDFYASKIDPALSRLSSKERMIWKYGGMALRKAAAVIFSTEWQRQTFEKAYGLSPKKTSIVENFYGRKEKPSEPAGRAFVSGAREIKLKNADRLKSAFKTARAEAARKGFADIDLDTGKAVYDNFVEKIRRAYAVVVPSLSEMSPNMALDAIRTGTPFILTKETGIADRVKDVAVFIDPLDERDIADKILWMADPLNRAAQAEKIERFSFEHSWEEIAREIIKVAKRTAYRS